MHLSLFLGLAFLGLRVFALPGITRQGKYLYNPDGERFYIRGIAYQEPGEYENTTDGFPEPITYVDALAQTGSCERDVPLLEGLGVNAIRAYSVDPDADHSRCMNLLDDAGIYVIADLSLPVNGSISREAPSWDTALLDQFLRSVDNLRQYPNVLAFNVGNEVVTATNETNTLPFVKAAARDVKAYLRSVNSSALVGYASTDGSEWRERTAEYLACGDPETSIDLFGLNNYRWCGTSTYEETYAGINEQFNDYPVAAYFSEFGCITDDRTWTELNALLSAPMSDNWSGGIAFQYFENEGDPGYGIVEGDPETATNMTTTADYNTLRDVLANLTAPPNTPAQGDSDDSAFPACPTAGADLEASSELPPTPNTELCGCAMENALACTTRRGVSAEAIGSLIDYTCSLLGQTTGDDDGCDPISSDGTTGTYGNFSYCAPEEKLSYIMSQYFIATEYANDACDFAGNATINRRAPTTSADADSALQECLEGNFESSTFTPQESVTHGAGGSGGDGAALASTPMSPIFASLSVSALAICFGASFMLVG